jgi:hypothetical protein
VYITFSTKTLCFADSRFVPLQNTDLSNRNAVLSEMYDLTLYITYLQVTYSLKKDKFSEVLVLTGVTLKTNSTEIIFTH